MSPHWRCAHAPEPQPLRQPCPVHSKRPCVLADCTCHVLLTCDYCGGIAYKHDLFGGRPICLDCFDQVVGGD